MIKVKINNNFLCQTLNLNLFTTYSHKSFEKHEFRHHFVTRV